MARDRIDNPGIDQIGAAPFITPAKLSLYFVPLCILLSILVRITWILAVNSAPVSDATWYVEKGLDIAAGRGYINNGLPTAYWPVGYPAFLGLVFAIFGPSFLAAKLANVLLYAGALACFYGCARELLRSEPAARLALVLLAFYPNQIAYSSLLLSENLFLFLMLGGALLILKDKETKLRLVAAGMVWGLATLIKPQVVFLPLLFLAVKFWKKKGAFLNAAVLYLALILTLLPWTVRNYQVFGRLVFVSTNGGINLLIGNNPYATGNYNYNDQVAALIGQDGSEASVDQKAQGAALGFIRQNPAAFISLAPQKIYYLFASDIEGFIWNQYGLPATSPGLQGLFQALELIAEIYYGLLLVLGITGALRLHLQKAHALIILVILYLVLINVVFFGEARFHFPIMPWIAILGAGGLILGKKISFAYLFPGLKNSQGEATRNGGIARVNYR